MPTITRFEEIEAWQIALPVLFHTLKHIPNLKSFEKTPPNTKSAL